MSRKKDIREENIVSDVGLISKEQVDDIFMNTNYDETFNVLRTLVLSLKFIAIGNLPCLENFVAVTNALSREQRSWTLSMILRKIPPYFLPILITDRTDELINIVNKISGDTLDKSDIDKMFGIIFIQTDFDCKKPSTYYLFNNGDIDGTIDELIRGVLAKPLAIYKAYTTKRFTTEQVLKR
ncbi:MAG: hypothetical protein JHC26_07535 [Thermofilum sp.]|jgi:hypothetical protein|uniref:hypothetical protein n=1 Tax=Thermofilum sp. TaxID=1961369 RepID=UPI00258BC1FD|nr:hypothetical protein [Thermofilum sp.]MCI4408929.1 hypothetical protein [Thermofilum sp.]